MAEKPVFLCQCKLVAAVYISQGVEGLSGHYVSVSTEAPDYLVQDSEPSVFYIRIFFLPFWNVFVHVLEHYAKGPLNGYGSAFSSYEHPLLHFVQGFVQLLWHEIKQNFPQKFRNVFSKLIISQIQGVNQLHSYFVSGTVRQVLHHSDQGLACPSADCHSLAYLHEVGQVGGYLDAVILAQLIQAENHEIDIGFFDCPRSVGLQIVQEHR